MEEQTFRKYQMHLRQIYKFSLTNLDTNFNVFYNHYTTEQEFCITFQSFPYTQINPDSGWTIAFSLLTRMHVYFSIKIECHQNIHFVTCSGVNSSGEWGDHLKISQIFRQNFNFFLKNVRGALMV